MWTFLKYLGIFSVIAGGCVALMSANSAPDELIVGRWVETDWNYEMADLPNGAEPADFLQEVKRSVGRGLVMHKAETWEFKDDNRLLLSGEGWSQEATWHIKGRGHLLRIIHADGSTETYVLDRLDRNTMRLQFETDIQARGIASLEFSRNHFIVQ